MRTSTGQSTWTKKCASTTPRFTSSGWEEQSKSALLRMRTVIGALQALRRIAQVAAVKTIAAELGGGFSLRRTGGG